MIRIGSLIFVVSIFCIYNSSAQDNKHYFLSSINYTLDDSWILMYRSNENLNYNKTDTGYILYDRIKLTELSNILYIDTGEQFTSCKHVTPAYYLSLLKNGERDVSVGFCTNSQSNIDEMLTHFSKVLIRSETIENKQVLSRRVFELTLNPNIVVYRIFGLEDKYVVKYFTFLDNTRIHFEIKE